MGYMKREAEADSIAIRAAVGSERLPRNAEEAENRAYRDVNWAVSKRPSSVCYQLSSRLLG